jgi:hypothetical protein
MKLVPSDQDAWIKILGQCELYKKFSNPYRKDKNPSAVLILSRDARNILLHDFKDGTFNWKSFLKFYNIGLNKKNFDPYTVVEGVTTVNKSAVITYQERNWEVYDEVYWNNYCIPLKVLNFYDVTPIAYTWRNGLIVHTSVPQSPVYKYKFGEHFKIYAPYHKCKWLSKVPHTVYQGYEQLPKTGDKLIITKSLKDVMVWKVLGFWAIAPQSECDLHEDLINTLKTRFKALFINFDNDATGIKYQQRNVAKFGLKEIMTENYKDISDMILKEKIKNVELWLQDTTLMM